MKYLVPGPSKSLTKSLTITDRKVPDSQTCTDASRVQHFSTPDVFVIKPSCATVHSDTRTPGQNKQQQQRGTKEINITRNTVKKKKKKRLEKPSYELTDNTLVARICLWRSVSCWILYSSSEIWAWSHVQRLPILALSASHFHSEV